MNGMSLKDLLDALMPEREDMAVSAFLTLMNELEKLDIEKMYKLLRDARDSALRRDESPAQKEYTTKRINFSISALSELHSLVARFNKEHAELLKKAGGEVHVVEHDSHINETVVKRAMHHHRTKSGLVFCLSDGGFIHERELAPATLAAIKKKLGIDRS